MISQMMGVKIEKKSSSLHCACGQMNGLHVASKGFQKFRAPPLKHDDDRSSYTPVGFPFLITDVSKPERQTMLFPFWNVWIRAWQNGLLFFYSGLLCTVHLWWETFEFLKAPPPCFFIEYVVVVELEIHTTIQYKVSFRFHLIAFLS